MCLPNAALSLLGTAFGTVGAIQEGRAQSQAYNAQAQADEQNAKIATQQAENAASIGAREERQIRQRGAAVAGAQRAAYGANGIDIGSGSALDVLSDTSFQNEFDALTIRSNTANTVWSNQAQATNFRNQASANRAAARNAKTANYLGAGTTLLTGYSKYKSMTAKSK